VQVEAYTALGVASGSVERDAGPRDCLEADGALTIDGGSWYPLDGSGPRTLTSRPVPADDILVLSMSEDPDGHIHQTWHPIEVDAGPFTLTGELPTQPGFDPGRSLARPTHTFVLLRDVHLELKGQPNTGAVDRPFALVNRYAIDRVATDLTLAFFFPGAVLETPEGRPAA
jgi:hypothetical protein